MSSRLTAAQPKTQLTNDEEMVSLERQVRAVIGPGSPDKLAAFSRAFSVLAENHEDVIKLPACFVGRGRQQGFVPRVIHAVFTPRDVWRMRG